MTTILLLVAPRGFNKAMNDYDRHDHVSYMVGHDDVLQG